MCTLNITPVTFTTCAAVGAVCTTVDHNGELCCEAIRIIAASVPFWAHPACFGFGHVVHLCGYCSGPTARARELVRNAALYITFACEAAPRVELVARKVRRAA
jgi:hypothetical protein